MLRNILPGLALATLLLGSAPASALFIPVSDDRSIHATYSDPYVSDVQTETPPTAFDAWNDFVYPGGGYWADQNSEAVTATRMAASGSAVGDYETGTARSTFSITFDVDVATSYTLSGTLVEHATADNESQISLITGSTTVFAAAANHDTVTFSDSGVLAPGTYTLLAEAEWLDDIDLPGGDASFDFAFEAVPEPGTAALTVLAGAALLGRARTKRRAARL